MGTESIASFTKNGGSGRWKMRKGVVLALTHAGLYYARSRAVLNRVVSRDPLLLDVHVLDISYTIEIILPFPTDDLKYLSQSVGKSIV